MGVQLIIAIYAGFLTLKYETFSSYKKQNILSRDTTAQSSLSIQSDLFYILLVPLCIVP